MEPKKEYDHVLSLGVSSNEFFIGADTSSRHYLHGTTPVDRGHSCYGPYSIRIYKYSKSLPMTYE